MMRPPRLLIFAALALVVALGAALTIGADYFAVRNGVDAILDPAEQAAARDDARRTLLQAAAGIAVLVAGFFTYWRIRLSEHAQLTERFTNAIEQLGSDQMAVRIGAIAALERIAKDSRVDRGTVSEVLSAFVREPSPTARGGDSAGTGEGAGYPADKAQACVVLGRARPAARPMGLASRRELWRVSLRGADLRYADLSGLDFSEADLAGADLSNVDMSRMKLENAVLARTKISSSVLDEVRARGADLSGAQVVDCSLVGADLSVARITGGARFENVRLQSASLDRATADAELVLADCNFAGGSMRRAYLCGAFLSEVNLVDADLRNTDFSDSTLSDVNLARANLSSARLNNAKVDNVSFRSAEIVKLVSNLSSDRWSQIQHEASIGSSRQKGASLAVKRLMDISVSVAALVVAAPVMLAAAAAIKIVDRGPVLFLQDRVGRRGRIFRLMKFRTMYVSAEERLAPIDDLRSYDGPLFKISNDPRITAVGRVLRWTSIDELPQLINVLKGEMSLVGPRPALPSEFAEFGDFGEIRTAVLPGITGLWQVSARGDTTFEQYRDMDSEYVRRWNLRLDWKVLAQTIVAIFRRR